MNGRISIALAAFLLACGPVCRGAQTADDEDARRMADLGRYMLKDAMEIAPESYVGAVVTVTDQAPCPPTGGEAACCLAVRIDELVAGSRPEAAVSPADGFLLYNGSIETCDFADMVGVSHLVVAVPLGGREGVYGSTVISPRPTEGEIAHLRAAAGPRAPDATPGDAQTGDDGAVMADAPGDAPRPDDDAGAVAETPSDPPPSKRFKKKKKKRDRRKP